ncbi:Ger(x)C family spore germination protein [Virgibacillus sp. LDC1]|uniref:Ger(x)C family spore germination protein n=1 Tax=unclassified Paenibacillus TaxID=185978 RepID=UPI000C27F0A9|nr:Ger(x)C family spore germination protein [Paenibacillus sp. GM2FR]MCV4235229.1 Ger(x)C family spore germination protein [Virgibacillus sp. LDC1]PJN49351.1 Spore germination protein B3 precursor [Paenibacillus sp. GM2FR]
MNRYARYVTAVTASVLLLLTTGCWSSNEIEDVSVYVGLGLDAANESKFERDINKQGASYPKRKVLTATVQIVPPITGKNEKQGGSGSSSPSKAYLNEQLTGDSLIQIFRQFSLRRDRPLIGHHLKVIVVSSELARKYSLEQVFDFILRDNDIRPSCLVVVSHRSAFEALSSTEPGEIPAFYLTGLVDNRYRSNKILPPVSLIKLDSNMQSGASFLLQNVVTAQNEHKFSGAAIFKGKTKKWIGELSQYDLEGLSWIKEDVMGGALKTYAHKTGHTVTYEPKNSHSTIIPKVRGDEISFHIKIHSEGRLIEDWSFPEIPSSGQYIKEMERQFEDEARKQIEQVLNKMQHVYHVDVGGFGEELRIKHPQLWKKLKSDWDETFSHVPITYEVSMNITDFGSSTD